MLQKVLHAKEHNIHVEGLTVKENANKPALKTETDFQCSNTWLQKFKLPHKNTQHQLWILRLLTRGMKV